MTVIVTGNIKERNQRMKDRGDGICETLGQPTQRRWETKVPGGTPRLEKGDGKQRYQDMPRLEKGDGEQRYQDMPRLEK